MPAVHLSNAARIALILGIVLAIAAMPDDIVLWARQMILSAQKYLGHILLFSGITAAGACVVEVSAYSVKQNRTELSHRIRGDLTIAQS